jgi:DNA-binding XRE family transcriptional regulator
MNPVFPLLRAARCLLGLSQVEAAKEFDMKAKTIHLLEAGNYKLLPREALVLRGRYQDAGVEFTEAADSHGAGVRWNKPGNVLEDDTLDLFGSRIMRAARGLANLSQRQLADAAKVDPSFIARLENNKYGAINEVTLRKVEAGLRAYNVEIMQETQSVGAGVRWIIDPASPVD